VPIALNGHIIAGLGASSKLIELQKPLLRDFLPGIAHLRIHFPTSRLDKWIPDSRFAASGMTG
jgi:hypothetical protein